MIVVDANLLIHAVNVDSPFHPKAKAWLESVVSGAGDRGIALACSSRDHANRTLSKALGAGNRI
jgi:NADH dehydrogenase FAD-containing subunit